MKKLMLVSLLLLTSCNFFTMDADPAIAAKQDQTAIFVEVADNFAEIIRTATGLSDIQRELILKRIREAVDEYELTEIAQIEFLNSVDDKNRDKLMEEIKILFQTLRSKL